MLWSPTLTSSSPSVTRRLDSPQVGGRSVQDGWKEKMQRFQLLNCRAAEMWSIQSHLTLLTDESAQYETMNKSFYSLKSRVIYENRIQEVARFGPVNFGQTGADSGFYWTWFGAEKRFVFSLSQRNTKIDFIEVYAVKDQHPNIFSWN